MSHTAVKQEEATITAPSGATVDAGEIDKFSDMAAEWWDPFGKFKPLHKFNPVRLAHIRDEICAHYGLNRLDKNPLAGLRLLDIGCGGGLVSEPMARLGAEVTGIDAAEKNVKTALTHADEQGLTIDYRATTAEQLLASGAEPYDVVLNLEVVEHVADVDLFLLTSASLLKPGGIMILSTINRTLKAFATTKFAAEYVLRWLPAGTHDQNKFVKPEEARKAMETAGLQVRSPVGLSYQMLLDSWRITDDASVNYMMSAVKAKG